MIKIKIYAIGKIKEKYFKDAIAEYSKMLKGYADLSIIEFSDLRVADNASNQEMINIKNAECKKVLEKISDDEFLFALDLRGKNLSSEDFAEKIQELTHYHSSLSFVIGASLGLSEEILERANFKISFGNMTYPHKLMRVILLEQIYRAFRIINKHPYHK